MFGSINFQSFFLVPLIPSGFNIIGQSFTVSNVTVMFAWDEPLGSGPEAVVDNYIVTVSPSPLFPSANNTLPNTPLSLNVTLDYNTTYVVSITAENCAGLSQAFTLPEFEYSKILPNHIHTFKLLVR